MCWPAMLPIHHPIEGAVMSCTADEPPTLTPRQLGECALLQCSCGLHGVECYAMQCNARYIFVWRQSGDARSTSSESRQGSSKLAVRSPPASAAPTIRLLPGGQLHSRFGWPDRDPDISIAWRMPFPIPQSTRRAIVISCCESSVDEGAWTILLSPQLDETPSHSSHDHPLLSSQSR